MGAILQAIGWTLFLIGWLLALLGGIWIIVLGWQRNILWGLVCLFVPITQIIYIAAHWKESRYPFCLQVVGLVLIVLAALTGVLRL